MSAREQLQREAALLKEGEAQILLDFLHHLPASPAEVLSAAKKDYFETYWRRWYGRCEGEEWEVPAELGQETREVW